jgi:hypothetical protein
MAYIHKDKCEELGLPEPKGYDTQFNYLLRCIKQGLEIHTYICRYIGIGNLHSLISEMKRKGIPITVEHKKGYCYFTNEIRPHLVDHIYMTAEQRNALTASDQTLGKGNSNYKIDSNLNGENHQKKPNK